MLRWAGSSSILSPYAMYNHLIESLGAHDDGVSLDDKASIQRVADAGLAIFLAKPIHDRGAELASPFKSSTAL